MENVYMVIDKRRGETYVSDCYKSEIKAEEKLESYRKDIRENSGFFSLADADYLEDNTYVARRRVI